MSLPPPSIFFPGVTTTRATVAGMLIVGSVSRNCCTAGSSVTPGSPSWFGLRFDGSMFCVSATVSVWVTARSTGSSLPSTLMPSTDDVPVSCGEPFTHLPVTCARSARRFSSSASKRSGTSASTAARTSIVATPGIVCGPGSWLVSGRWSGIGRPATRSSPRPPAAVAVWPAGSPEGGWISVVADSRLPVTGSGDAGRFPPAWAVLHVGSPLLAVIGSMRGLGPIVAASALASHV